MKKLMFAAAIFAGASAFALEGSWYLYTGFDLADASKWPTVTKDGTAITWWNLLSHRCTSETWTMTADVTKNITSFQAKEAKEATSSQPSVGVVDLGGHTLTLDSKTSPTLVAYSEKGMAGQHVTFELKNGVYSGGTTTPTTTSETPNFHIGGWDNSSFSFENGTTKVTDLVITNFAGVYIGRSCQNTDIQFKNVEITAPNIALSDVNHLGETDLTVTFTDCVLNWTYSDGLTDAAGGVSDLTLNFNRKYLFTGSKTRVHPAWHPTGAARAFMIGYAIPYGQITFDDGAVLCPEGSVQMGYTATAKNWRATFDHEAAMKLSHVLYVGRSAGGQTMVFKNGSILKAPGVAIGYSASGVGDNTLILSNADISACNGFRVGAWDQPKSGVSHNNKLYFCGQDMKFRPSGSDNFPVVVPCFYGADGLACFDNTTYTNLSTDCNFYPVNTNDVDGTQAWENNEIRFDNGTTVSMRAMNMGRYSAGGTSCDGQKLTFGNNVNAYFKGFMNSGSRNTITVSNATVTAGQNDFYVGYNDKNTDHAVGENTVVIAGSHPKIRALSEGEGDVGVAYFWNNTTMRFILPENAQYDDVPVLADSIWCGASWGKGEASPTTADAYATTFEFPNLEEVRATIVGTKEVELMRSKGGFTLSTFELSQAYTSASEKTALPEGCSLTKRANAADKTTSLILTIKGSAFAKPGAVLLIK